MPFFMALSGMTFITRVLFSLNLAYIVIFILSKIKEFIPLKNYPNNITKI